MAHEIDFSNNRANVAWTGERNAVWHGLGSQMQEGQTLDQWKETAGLNWEIFESRVMYQSGLETKTMDDKKVLFRSDTKDALAVVGSEYKIVQPTQVVDFFQDLMTIHGMKMSTMGSLFGGRRFWALAEIGKDFETVNGDKIEGYMLLCTSADGTLSTVAKVTSHRVVCNNMLTVALGQSSKNMIKTSHRSIWDAKQVKIDLGLIDSCWTKFADNMKKMATVKLTDLEVEQYLSKKFYDANKTAEDQTWGTIKTVNMIKQLFTGGLGSEYAQGTAYNLLNAVTEFTDHYGVRKVDAGRKFMENSFGKGDDLKTEVYNDMLALMV